MINKYPKCNDCIKEDVCGIKKDVTFAYEQIMNVNTTQDDCSVHYAKDNKNLDITVLCNRFSQKHGLSNTTFREVIK